jgi:5S rRNA maturation endonuclease (ribonuclease M5)
MKKQRGVPSRRDLSSQKAHLRGTSLAEHAEGLRNWGLYDLDIERAERLREVLESLHEANRHVPIIVEGKRDVAALREIGFTGEIIAVHGGKGIYEFCEDLAERFRRVVLLTDWDEQGEVLHRKLSEHLRGISEEFAFLREIIRFLCQKEVKDIEGVPALLERLSGARVTMGESGIP